MESYVVIARKFRPKTFSEVCGQESIVQTIKNAISYNRTAHAYLFCGPRGTGKTTLARIFAKTLNCIALGKDHEPCNSCNSCKEINDGTSLDVIEIDGASNRGIDDIRQINETIHYAPASGLYKIYIIDEVHMLTKEAFNALLKTLEEPPRNVKFFLATTEPHKVLPTILSRCVRFDLGRISEKIIVDKLVEICKELKASFEIDALKLLANQAEGSLRDAETMLDQILCYHHLTVTKKDVESVLGFVTDEIYRQLDEAFRTKNISFAFVISDLIFSKGINYSYFLEGLVGYFKGILLAHAGFESSLKDKKIIYSLSDCSRIIEYLAEVLSLKSFNRRIQIEMVLLKILKISKEVSIDELIDRLSFIERTPSKEIYIKEEDQIISESQKSSLPVLEERIVEQSGEVKEVPKQNSTNNFTSSNQSRIDTLVRFASIELNGSIRH